MKMQPIVLENEYATYHWENEVVVITFKKIKGTLESSKKIVSDRLKITGGKPCVGLADIRSIICTDRESMNYFDTEDSKKGMVAAAVLVESFISSFLANLFLRVNQFKNHVPTRIFNKKEDALEWLQQYKTKRYKIESSVSENK